MAPNPSTGSQPTHELGTHHQAWDPHQTTLDISSTTRTTPARRNGASRPHLRPSVGFPIRARVPNDTDITQMQHLLNTRPRMTLDWRTPAETLNQTITVALTA